MIFRVFLLNKIKIPRLHSKGEVRGTTLFITCFIDNGMNRPELKDTRKPLRLGWHMYTASEHPSSEQLKSDLRSSLRRAAFQPVSRLLCCEVRSTPLSQRHLLLPILWEERVFVKGKDALYTGKDTFLAGIGTNELALQG